MYIGGVLQAKFNTRTAVSIGGMLIVSGTFLASFCENLTTLLLTHGVLFGLGVGLAYTAPITCAVTYFPNRKGLVTGTIVGRWVGGLVDG
jgi:OFA family oxalate/formate antiporter-like MFS transporter